MSELDTSPIYAETWEVKLEKGHYISKQDLFNLVVGIIGGKPEHVAQKQNSPMLLSEENPYLSVSLDQNKDQPTTSITLIEGGEKFEYGFTKTDTHYEMTLNGELHKPLVQEAQKERRKIAAFLLPFLPDNPGSQIS